MTSKTAPELAADLLVALMEASADSFIGVVERQLAAGADPNLRVAGQCAMDYVLSTSSDYDARTRMSLMEVLILAGGNPLSDPGAFNLMIHYSQPVAWAMVCACAEREVSGSPCRTPDGRNALHMTVVSDPRFMALRQLSLSGKHDAMDEATPLWVSQRDASGVHPALTMWRAVVEKMKVSDDHLEQDQRDTIWMLNKKLLDAGADFHARDDRGQCASDYVVLALSRGLMVSDEPMSMRHALEQILAERQRLQLEGSTSLAPATPRKTVRM